MISCLIFQLVSQIVTLEISDLQLPRITHEFPRSSLRYQLISTLNEISPEIIEMAKNCTQYIFINHVRKSIVDGYRDACVKPDNCYSCTTNIVICMLFVMCYLLFVCNFTLYPIITSSNNNNNHSVLLYLIHSYICRVCIILYFIAGM